MSDTKDDDGGLQWDFISRYWVSYTKSGAVLKSPSIDREPGSKA